MQLHRVSLSHVSGVSYAKMLPYQRHEASGSLDLTGEYISVATPGMTYISYHLGIVPAGPWAIRRHTTGDTGRPSSRASSAVNRQ